jgi:ferrous-iron efflux pump FieF
MFISGSALFLFLTGIQHLVRPEPLQAAGVGVVVTLPWPKVCSSSAGCSE